MARFDYEGGWKFIERRKKGLPARALMTQCVVNRFAACVAEKYPPGTPVRVKRLGPGGRWLTFDGTVCHTQLSKEALPEGGLLVDVSAADAEVFPVGLRIGDRTVAVHWLNLETESID